MPGIIPGDGFLNKKASLIFDGDEYLIGWWELRTPTNTRNRKIREQKTEDRRHARKRRK